MASQASESLPEMQRFDASALIAENLHKIKDLLGELAVRTTTSGTTVRFLYIKQQPKKGINVKPLLLLLNRHLVAYAVHNAPQFRSGPKFDVEAYDNAGYVARTKFRSTDDVSGQLGEFLLFCLIEAYLGAPQAVAKMHYKQENQKEVPGVDGIHVRWDATAKVLTLIWGEAKLEKDATDGLRHAFESLADWRSNGKDSEDWDFLTGVPSQLYPGLETHLKQYRENGQTGAFTVQDEYAIFAGFQEGEYDALLQQNPNNLADAFLAYYETTCDGHAGIAEKHQGKLPKPWAAVNVFLLPFPSLEDIRQKFEKVIHGHTVSEAP